jgi:hypothetical protein
VIAWGQAHGLSSAIGVVVNANRCANARIFFGAMKEVGASGG